MLLRRFLLDPTCVFAYRFDDIVDIRDRFTVGGKPTFVKTEIGSSIKLNGTADFLTFNSVDEKLLRFDGSAQDFSIFVRLKRITTGVTHIIFDKRDGSGDGYIIYFASDKVYFEFQDVTVGSTGTIKDAKLHSIAITFDRDGNGQIYIDSVEDGNGSISGKTLSTTTAPRLGARSHTAPANYLNAIVPELIIWKRLISTKEISNLAEGHPF